MTKPKLDPARIVADNLDASPDISAETVIKKLVVRWRIIASCTLLVPLVAVGLSHLIPPTYKSNAQILIRHQGGVNLLYTDIAPSQISLTGPTSSELLRSDPISSQMIEAVGVTDADIARPAFKVLFGRAAALIMPLLGRDYVDPQSSGGDSRYKFITLADELKPSITTTTLMAERGASTPRDEVIEVTVKSTNREKVAHMVNGLCEAFIREYNSRSKEELLAAHRTLAEQVSKIEADIARLNSTVSREHPAIGVTERAVNADNKPLASTLARKISEFESQLITLQETFTETSPEVVRLKAELEKNRSIFNNQESLDAANELISTIKKKQRQLLLAAQLFENNQGNLSIVERGLTPRKSKILVVMRYGVPAIAGIVGGLLIGLVAALLLNLLDPRLFLAEDVATVSNLPLLGVIPPLGIGTPDVHCVQELPLAPARPALLQTLAKLDLLPREATRATAISSADNESATAEVALQLAALLARDRDRRVLLIDANFDQPALTPRGISRGSQKDTAGKSDGVLDILAGQSTIAKATRATTLTRLFLLTVGRLELRDEIGSNQEKWSQFWTTCRKEYDTIIIHTGGLLNSREAIILAKTVEHVVLVTNRRASTRPSLQAAVRLLPDVGAVTLGILHCNVPR